MLKIMFVCHGNICRSPSAEILLKSMIKEEGVEDRFFVSSAATSTEEIFNGIGNPIYPPMAKELRRHGLSPEGKRAVQLTAADLGKYDMFIGMDSANVRNMKRILGAGSESKISKLMEYTERGGDVADPWYSERFDVAFSDIEEGCRALLDHLLANGY